ncbi:metallophosphoesterase family protein [Niallia sp. Krafla_26]|uniref:metallophosphoesterase family protein n=1 Tax=Niallia sp. Krafla_26 TaxID=3064703 RepID=UPI003D163384
MKTISFIHAADLHLDSPMVGLSYLPKEIFERLKESTFTALSKVVDAAIHHEVDFVILAGDLFDEQDRSIRAQTRLRKEMDRLKAAGIEAFVVHGNHDHLNGDWVHIEMPDNVHIFPDYVDVKSYRKHNTLVHLYGFSYPTRHLEDNQLFQYRKKEGADFHIGILHGHYEGNSEHSRYASFTTTELLDKKFDYWALGHIHKRQIIHNSPYISYPGNIQGRNRKEVGEKGCYLVKMSDVETDMEFIKTADIIWDELDIDCSNVKTFQDLYILVQKMMEEKRTLGHGRLLSISLSNLRLNDKEWMNVKNGDILQALQDEEKSEDSFVWPITITTRQAIEWDRNTLKSESAFYKEMFQTADQFEIISQSMKPLYDHPVAAKFLDPLSDEEKQEIQQEALDILVTLLKKGG